MELNKSNGYSNLNKIFLKDQSYLMNCISPKQKNLIPDGVVGPLTLKALGIY